MEEEKGFSHNIYQPRSLTAVWHVFYPGIDRPVAERIRIGFISVSVNRITPWFKKRKLNMDPTLTQSGALYLAQHQIAKRRSAFFRRIKVAARKQTSGIVTSGKSSRLPPFNPDNGR